jgi:hypothetical protein
MMKKSILFIIILSCLSQLNAQNKKFEDVSIDALMTETQYGSDDPDRLDLIWWIPTEYWNVVFSQDPSTSQSDTDEVIKLVGDYVFIMVLKGSIGTFGGITYEDEAQIKKQVSVTYKGTKLKIVETKDLGAYTVNFLSMMKPMMKNMMGDMGENMQFYVFENPGKEDIIPIDPYSNETLTFNLGSFEKNVMLPLGSLLQEKMCPETKELHSGKWTFCPYHGVKLVEKKD